MPGYDHTIGLLQVKKAGTSTWVTIPNKYIKLEEYKITPNQMLDLDSYRSETGVLLRNVLSHTATKAEYQTPIISETDLAAMMTIIRNGYTDTKAHTLELKYYVPETQSYKTGTFYVPDIDYTIRQIDDTNNKVTYNPVRVAFIEY